jgi:hypothetical protein
MSIESKRNRPKQSRSPISMRQFESMKGGLEYLWRSNFYARDVNRDAWDFAVDYDELAEKGLTELQLRWLVANGFVAHAQEISRLDDDPRRFRPSSNLLAPRTGFIITPKGRFMVEHLHARGWIRLWNF